MYVIGRLRSNSALYDIPEVPVEKKRGKPKKYGKKMSFDSILSNVLTKSKLKLGNGKLVDTLFVERIVLVKWRSVPLKVVGVLIENATKYVWLYSTDLELTAKEIIFYYGTRWNIETDFEMLKGYGGLEDYQLRIQERILRFVNIILWATSIMKLATLILTKRGKDVWKCLPKMSWYKPVKWTIHLIKINIQSGKKILSTQGKKPF